jgi:hypothetical protein
MDLKVGATFTDLILQKREDDPPKWPGKKYRSEANYFPYRKRQNDLQVGGKYHALFQK